MIDRSDREVRYPVHLKQSLVERIDTMRVRWGDSKRVFFKEALEEHLARLRRMEGDDA